MSDERQAFEQLHAIPSGAIWCENRDVYIHKNYSGLVLHPINESWEAFCEGALWQASRQDFECEPVAEVAQVGGTPVVFWDKSLTVGTKLYTRTASRHALSSCSEIPNSSGHASRQAVSVPEWIKCSDRLPDVLDVWIKMTDGSVVACWSKLDGDFYWNGGGSESYILENTVTHWKPRQQEKDHE